MGEIYACGNLSTATGNGYGVKRSVLILLSRYLPGVKSGGPIRSISSLVEALGDHIDFRIVTSDRDKDDDSPYPGIQPDAWTKVGKARVLYVSPARLGISSLFRVIASEQADFLYLNTFFSRRFSILPLMARMAGAEGQKEVVLAPRGEFSPGALQLKRWRKKVFLESARRLPIYRNLIWHASSAHEEQDIRLFFGPDAMVRTALPISHALRDSSPADYAPINKTPGAARIVFLSRIVPKKNLLVALQMLRGVQGVIEFNIYGPAEDASYWSRCEAEIRSLGPNIRVAFHSLVDHSAAGTIFGSHHLFLFPTLGENYGHVIYEALSAGCPVLISDRTPWRGLAKTRAGWDLPLEQPELFRKALEDCVAMTESEFHAASARARAFADSFVNQYDLLAAYLALFAPGGTR